MALLRINGELKEFSINRDVLTLTNEEYESYPGAKKYALCITEDKLITRFGEVAKPKELISAVAVKDSGIVFTTRTTIGSIDESGEASETPRLISPGNRKHVSECGISWKPKTNTYHNSISNFRYGTQAIDEHITHLYSRLMFAGSVYRDQHGGLISANRKIIRCSEFQNHYLVKYEGSPDLHLLLRCYSNFYDVKFDYIPPGSMTKNARSGVEIAGHTV